VKAVATIDYKDSMTRQPGRMHVGFDEASEHPQVYYWSEDGSHGPHAMNSEKTPGVAKDSDAPFNGRPTGGPAFTYEAASFRNAVAEAEAEIKRFVKKRA
jgi:hypothetical protein